ncbi:MAG: putative TauD/TfdA family dioxygenase [Rhodospirillales bacterium]|nr:putative TauD/TfdA family dioxygenase [Rhodospirillales bacterium]
MVAQAQSSQQPSEFGTGSPAVRPLCDAVGAEVTGVDLTNLDQATFSLVQAAWRAHSALLFRNQQLDDAALIEFSRRFGELDMPPVNENGKTFVADHPEIYVVSNVLGADGVPIGSLGAGEAVWHTDMSYLPMPPDASMLYSLEVPPSGGDTWLCGMDRAAGELPDDLRRTVTGRSIKHDGTYNSGGYLRQGLTASDDPVTSVGTPHPILCRHAETGRETLYLGRRRNAYVIGLPLAESEALLDRLWAHATQAKFCIAHHWRVGDLLMWDNRSTMHRRDPFDAHTRRVMHRTQIKGSARPAPSGVSAA